MGWRECMGDTLYTVMTTRASAVLTNYVLPKHGAFLFLWVGEICYFDILSNCEQSLLATFYDNNWTKCSCTFIIINNYSYLPFKLSLQFLDELEMSMFLCKKKTLCLCLYVCTKKSKQKYTKSLSLLNLELKYSFSLHFSKSESILFHFALS